jgi:hypothetical protein
MATARSQPKPKPVVANPFGLLINYLFKKKTLRHLGVMMNARQRPTLIQATQATGLRATTAFTTGLTLPGGYT